MNKTKFTTIRLDENERAAVDSKMNETGLGQAAAIRLIIREWSEMKKQYITVPVKGTVNPDGTITWKMREKKWSAPITIEEELDRR